VVLVPAMLVAFVAILQFAVLPPDVMKHFGYGPQTIDAVETINNNAQYQRVAGTLRGPNPLGAYLLVIITLLVAQWRVSSARLRLAVYILSCGFALAFSFSRSAWLGLLVSGAIVLVASATTARLRRLMVLGIAGFMLITGAVFVGIRDNAAVQNAVFHTEDRSSVALSSNDQREQALRAGLKDVADEPLGRGVGTAGPASVYNQDGPVRIAENYYLQVGQEVGWLGLSLFVAINVVVLVRLWALRRDPLALGVFAAGCGLVVVNMLSHAWTDDTLAYIWWGLAALALSRNVLSSRKSDAKTA
jgi:O-antigen ligase